jgi:hypothetical protein
LTLFLPPPIVNVVIRWAQGQNFGANTNAVKFPIEDPAYPAAGQGAGFFIGVRDIGAKNGDSLAK